MRWGKWKWILIPLLVYALTVSCGLLLQHSRRAKIARMYEAAQRADLPLLITYSQERIWFGFRLHSLDGESVGLDPGNKWPIQGLSASQDGSTVYYWTMIGTEPRIHLWRFSLPEDRPSLIAKCDLEEFLDFPNNTGFDCLAAPWRLEGDGDGFSLINVATGERTPLDLEGGAPWEEPSWNTASYRLDVAYPELRDALFLFDERSAWRYDIGLDEWNEVGSAVTSGAQFAVSADGNVVARITVATGSSSRSGCNTEFVDARTGASLAMINDAACISIGERWAVCVQGVSILPVSFAVRSPFTVRILDMQNGWAESRIVLNERAVLALPYEWGLRMTILEP